MTIKTLEKIMDFFGYTPIIKTILWNMWVKKVTREALND